MASSRLKYGLPLFAAVLAAGVAPFVRVDQYKEQIRDGLERALHRRVEINGEAHLNLFRGPGFTVQKVVIHDAESAGIEPLANVAELQTTVSLRSLWAGRLEFAAVRFVEPHLNLVKLQAGTWNIFELVAGATPKAGTARLPRIEVSGGRINFKLGDVKSSFYLTGTDLTVSPSLRGVEIRFACAPARTDRTEQGYGLFSGRGTISGGRIDLDMELEKSPVEDLVTLVRGQSLGLHGLIASKAKISGSLSQPAITGRFTVEDVHRWDLIGGRASIWSMAYNGNLDVAAQQLEIRGNRQTNPNSPATLRVLVTQLLTQPNWLFELGIDRLPASGLVEFARHMGAPLPPGLVSEGEVFGTVQYGSARGVEGELTLENAAVRLDRGAVLRLPEAAISIEGDEVRLSSADLSVPGNQARIELRYAPFREQLEASLTGRNLRVADLQDGTGHLLNGIAVPFLDRFKGGTWTGVVHYLSGGDTPAQWSAQVQLHDTSISIPGLAPPLTIAAADVDLAGEKVTLHRIRATAGELEIFGDYRYDPQGPRPHRFSATVPAADAAELQRLLMPSLKRGTGFLARTLRWKSSLPEWLRERRAFGQIRIGTLTLGDYRLRAVRSHMIWAGGLIELPDLEAKLDGALLDAKIRTDLSSSEPQYSITGRLQGWEWRNGRVDLDGAVETTGTGIDVLANLRADGTFQGHAVTVTPDLALRTLTGSFELGVTRSGPQVRLSGLQAAIGTERFNGVGSTQPDGRLLVDLSSPERTMRVSGPIASLKLEVTDERQNSR